MRRIIGIVGATLATVAAIAAFADPAGTPGQGSVGGVNHGFGDGSERFVHSSYGDIKIAMRRFRQ